MDCPICGCPLRSVCPHVNARTAEQCSRVMSRGSDTGYLPLDDCDDNGVYLLDAKHSGVGIFHRATQSFTVVEDVTDEGRTCEEFHCDAGKNHGSARPFSKIEQAPPLEGADVTCRYLQSVEMLVREKELHG